ncbi:MFS transporter [Ruegeria sp. EL01]|uniref:MFS transporter n=1 Tax=Ruegeria sp. EL01 TaxID=2107578 RepID=UPI0013C4F0E4|nr:MFS transporter [Ruegeria sp. EL01]
MKTSSWTDLFRNGLAIYSIIFGCSVALHALNVFVAATIMPSVVEDIGGLEVYAWSSTVFVVISIVSAALASRLMAFGGANLAYLFASVVFLVGTLLCALAPDIWTLIAGRAVQGFGGGLYYALAYAVIRRVYPAGLWTVAIGLITMMWGIATLTGPALGGIFAEIGSWRMAFWVLVPFACVIGVAGLKVMPAKSKKADPYDGVPVLQIIVLVAIVLILSVGSIDATPVKAIASIGAAALFWVALYRLEDKSNVRLLPVGSLTMRSALGMYYAIIALLLIGMQPEIFVPYLLQILHQQSPLWAGYIGALMALGWTAGSMLSATWTGKRAANTIVLAPAFGLIGLLAQAWILPPMSGGTWPVLVPVCLSLISVGFGIGLTWPHIVTRVYEAASDAEKDIAAGGVTTVQLVATAIGAALGGMVVNLAGISDPGGAAGASSASRMLFLWFAIAPALGLFIAFRLARPEQTDKSS